MKEQGRPEPPFRYQDNRTYRFKYSAASSAK